MTILNALVHPEWSSSHILLETYVHSSLNATEEDLNKFGEFFDNFSNQCCIRLAHVSEKELPVFTYRLMPKENGLSIVCFKNVGQYSAGTYLLVSAEIKDGGKSSSIDSATDVIAGHVGLVRVIWGPRAAWSLVQRSIVDVSSGATRDPSPVILFPNIHNRIWDDDIDKEELILALNNSTNSDLLWRSLRLASRGSDSTEPDKALWFWSAMEVLCRSEKEAEIAKALAKAYGRAGDWKAISEKFGIRDAARARHDIAHKGNFRAHGGETTEYYAALYIDLLSGLYLHGCVKRAERMIENGFNICMLKQNGSEQRLLNLEVNDDHFHSE